MNEYLDKLKWLYLHVPAFGNNGEEGLRNTFEKYLPLLADIGSMNEDYRADISKLNERVEDIETLISAVRAAGTKEDKEKYFNGAQKCLKKDIRTLIEIIEIKSN